MVYTRIFGFFIFTSIRTFYRASITLCRESFLRVFLRDLNFTLSATNLELWKIGAKILHKFVQDFYLC